MSTQCLVRGPTAAVDLRLRFLQLQTRGVERADPRGASRFEPVAELRSGDRTWLTWDEAVAHEVELGPYPLAGPTDGRSFPVSVPGGTDIEPLTDQEDRGLGRIVRRRWPLAAEVRVAMTPLGTGADGLVRLTVTVDNIGSPASDKPEAIRGSFIGTHLILAVARGEFVSLLEPPDDARAGGPACEPATLLAGARRRAGRDGRRARLADHPLRLPARSPSRARARCSTRTEIDEILTLRVMTLTDEEKAAARATDPACRGDHRPLRRDVAGEPAGPARHPARPARRDGCDLVPGSGSLRRTARPASCPHVRRAGQLRDRHPQRRTAHLRHRRCPVVGPGRGCQRAARGGPVMISGVPVAKDSLVRLHSVPARRRPGPLLRRPDGAGHRRPQRRGRPDPRRRRAHRRSGAPRPARVVRLLHVLRSEELEPLGRRSTADHVRTSRGESIMKSADQSRPSCCRRRDSRRRRGNAIHSLTSSAT